MKKEVFSNIQIALDDKNIHTYIQKHGDQYILYVNFEVHSYSKTRITAKRRIIDIANIIFNIKINRYQ
jgi:hypothetical protein